VKKRKKKEQQDHRIEKSSNSPMCLHYTSGYFFPRFSAPSESRYRHVLYQAHVEFSTASGRSSEFITAETAGAAEKTIKVSALSACSAVKVEILACGQYNRIGKQRYQSWKR
jgi:hypothetical protein